MIDHIDTWILDTGDVPTTMENSPTVHGSLQGIDWFYIHEHGYLTFMTNLTSICSANINPRKGSEEHHKCIVVICWAHSWRSRGHFWYTKAHWHMQCSDSYRSSRWYYPLAWCFLPHHHPLCALQPRACFSDSSTRFKWKMLPAD